MDIHPVVNAALRRHVLRRLTEQDHGFSDLNLHQVSVHCNGAALGHRPDEAEDAHHHEHYGPGGIRNHDYADRSWDPAKVATVLIECAEMDLTCDPTEAKSPEAFDIWRAAVDALMTPPTVMTATAPAEHVHLAPAYVRHWNGVVCPDGVNCEAYPRLYDVRVERTHDDDVVSASSSALTSRADDIIRCLLAANAALDFSTAVASENARHYPGLLPVVEKAQTQLTSAIAMLHPILYPAPATDLTDQPEVEAGDDPAVPFAHSIDVHSPAWAAFVETHVEAVKDALRSVSIDPIEPEINVQAIAALAVMFDAREDRA